MEICTCFREAEKIFKGHVVMGIGDKSFGDYFKGGDERISDYMHHVSLKMYFYQVSSIMFSYQSG